ncbi:MAG TPA: hypothetical protein VGM54_09385 [Chthoniobacter sp.]|jgi:hypothetical protein
MNYRLSFAGLLLSGFLVLGSALSVFGDGLENGDFAKGKSKWLGEGQVAYLKPDGSISPTDDSKPGSSLGSSLPPSNLPSNLPFTPAPGDARSKSTPLIEIKLRNAQFSELSQKFRTPRTSGALMVQVVYKGSPDFKLNDKANIFSREITWGPGTTWYWTAVVFPKVDLCFRLDRRDTHSYRLAAVKPGGDWQTMKFRWDDVGENQDVALLLLAAPGHGSVWIKSVAVSAPGDSH